MCRRPPAHGVAVIISATRAVLLATVLLAATAGPPARAQQRIPEGCVAADPAAGAPNPCSYTARGDAAYVARGDWTLTIQRRGRTSVMRSGEAPDLGPPGVVRSGDVVTAFARTPGSAVAVTRTAAADGAGHGPCRGGSYGTGGSPQAGSPDDPLFDRRWALVQLGVPAAWEGGRGGGATVAVVDTGVDLDHPDPVRRLVPGADLWATRPGAEPDCEGPQDEQFHGTTVAGVIAAEADNGVGIAGVAPAARIMPVRVRDAVESLDFSRVAAGIRWAADQGADVISLTGGVAVPVRPDPVLAEQIAEAVEHAWRRGAVTVATAGNTSLPWCQYPSSSRHVVCAAANGRDGRPARYSQSPFRLDGGVAVRAPGGTRTGGCDAADDVWSTSPPGAPAVDGCGERGYGTDSGTTYATAHVAGVAALLAGRELDNEAIVACLKATSSNGGASDPLTGHGTIDAAAAVGCARSRPAPGRR